MFVTCNFDKVFFSPVPYIVDAEAKNSDYSNKTPNTDKYKIYSPGQLEKSKRSVKIFSFGSKDLPLEQFTKGPSIVCGTSRRNRILVSAATFFFNENGWFTRRDLGPGTSRLVCADLHFSVSPQGVSRELPLTVWIRLNRSRIYVIASKAFVTNS